MSSCYITTSYHIIWYLMFFYFMSSADLISILFYSIEFDLLYCSVLYLISMNDLCLSVCLCLCVCLFICMNKFMFSLLTCFFNLSLLSFLMNVFLTHTRTRTHKYIWIYVPSYDSYILLQKRVSEESYSSDSIISYLI